MFNNIGRKIKVLANVVCWIGIIGSVIAGIAMMAANSWWNGVSQAGLALLLLGPLFSWVGSFVLYGFGELIEKTVSIESALRAKTGHIASPIDNSLHGSRAEKINDLFEKGLISEDEYTAKMKEIKGE